ncbi:MAG: response regulator transcription factor [Methyloprofundus sp.]|nr:response regulator transcription factor [Methyloprofundus sp.]
MTIRVILVDDHAVVRAGFKMLLSVDDEIVVVAEAERGEQAITLYQKMQPDVVVMDLSMPGIGGLEAIKRIVAQDNHAKILVFSVNDEQVFIDRAVTAGAKGFISKNSAASDLTGAIKKVSQGLVYLESIARFNSDSSNSEVSTGKQAITDFSSREFDVFLLLAKGKTAKIIADELSLSYKTVANYSTQIKKKLDVNSVAELAHIAVLYGMLNN